MNDEQKKNKLWKTYGIFMGVMLGGSVLVLLGQSVWDTIQQQLAQSAIHQEPSSINSSPLDTSSTPISPTQSSQSATSNSLTKEDAFNLINRYMEAKEKIF